MPEPDAVADAAPAPPATAPERGGDAGRGGAAGREGAPGFQEASAGAGSVAGRGGNCGRAGAAVPEPDAVGEGVQGSPAESWSSRPGGVG
ncbi:hypothetical protein ACIBSR_18630 [Streptomyces sp. NPDC049936]|uniref:hypothetical protein n=1 Tax=Streptomyces sp. NPDC049936 TaxID=3365599 RepID=UPI0037A324BB